MDIVGAKGGGGGSSDKGENRGPEIASVAYMKILLALTEGEAAGGFTGKDIYLDGTPLLDDAGAENFPGVIWEWRSGTVDQEYISGFPAVENEIVVSTELKYGTPWVKSITNTQLSAVRLRVKFPNGLYELRDSGGKTGYTVEYAVDISTDGNTYVEYGRDAASGIGNTGYERSYRIDLPPAQSGWQIRVRRLTANANDARHADTTRIESITDIVDVKLRYPHTALLFVQFDSQLFDGRTPIVTVKMKGIIVRVPSNYDPNSRTYSGTWDGTFKWAWTNNPAWIFYDLVINARYGLGRRITSDLVDKWTLYRIAQYCDARVSDGAGGTEARHLCDLYISQRTDAWTVLMDLAAIFRGMISWSNNLLSVDADMPRELDPDFVFNKSNIVGSFNFSSSSERTNYSAAIITYSNPSNGYNDDQASVHVKEVSSRFGFNTMEMTAVGCTRDSEAQRRGLWGIETNRDDNAVEFKTGMEGRIPRVGTIIGVNNAPLAGRANGGRVAAAAGTKITLDRNTKAGAGDRLIINLPTGKAEGRTIQSVSGRAVTVDSAYSVQPNVESAWVIDQHDLAIQLFRVRRIAIGSDDQVTISGLPYNPNKFAKIDDGAIVEDRPVTVLPPRGQAQPMNILIASSYRVDQGIGITTMEVMWDGVENAIAYEAQWRQNSGDWINVPRTGNTRFTVDGIYSGRYTVRVRAINALDIASLWALSAETELTGKTGTPPVPVNLRTTPLLWGIRLDWGIPVGAEDTLFTEIQYSSRNDGAGALLLCDVVYPQSTYSQMGLKAGQEFWYRARLVDRIGNRGGWTGWVAGQASADVSDITEQILEEIKESDVFKDFIENAVDSSEKIADLAGAIKDNAAGLAAAVGSNKQTAEAIIHNAMAIADVVTRQTAQNGANSAKFEQLREVIATETEARVTDVKRLEAKTEQNEAGITEVRQAIADETQARATSVNQLTAATKVVSDKADAASGKADAADGKADSAVKAAAENTASITELNQAVTTLDSAMASQLSELAAKTERGSAGAQNNAIALISNTLAQVNMRTTMSVQYGDNKAGIERVDNVMADASKAVAESLKTLDASAGGGSANVTDFAQTMADFSQVSATKINSLSVTVDGQKAAIEQNSKVTADINNNLSAMYNIKVGVDANGRQYAAGMGIGVQNTPSGMQSQVLFLADRFAVMAQAGGNVSLPFVIENGQAFFSDAFFRKASIDFGVITDSLKSINYAAGAAGWNLPKSGNAEFNQITVRGAIYATNGQFGFSDNGRGVVLDGRGLRVNFVGGGFIHLGDWD